WFCGHLTDSAACGYRLRTTTLFIRGRQPQVTGKTSRRCPMSQVPQRVISAVELSNANSQFISRFPIGRRVSQLRFVKVGLSFLFPRTQKLFPTLYNFIPGRPIGPNSPMLYSLNEPPPAVRTARPGLLDRMRESLPQDRHCAPAAP